MIISIVEGSWSNRTDLESAIFKFFWHLKVNNKSENLGKYLNGFRRYGCLHSDTSKYGDLKKMSIFFFTNVMIYSQGHTIQAHACQIS